MSLKVTATIAEQERCYLDVDTYASERIKAGVDIKDFKHRSAEENISCTSYTSPDFIIVDAQMQFATTATDIFTISGNHVMMDFVFKGEVNSSVKQEDCAIVADENSHNISYRDNLFGNFEISPTSEMGFMSFILTEQYYKILIQTLPDTGIDFFRDIHFNGQQQLSKNYLPLNFEIQSLLNQIRKTKVSAGLAKKYLDTKIQELLLLQAESYNQQWLVDTDKFLNNDDVAKLHQAKSIIEANFIHAPSIAKLCRMVGLNEFKMKKGFKLLFKTAIKSYVIYLRMNYAIELLNKGNYLVSEIAAACGYNSIENFSAAFKKFHGCSPKKKCSLDSILFSKDEKAGLTHPA